MELIKSINRLGFVRALYLHQSQRQDWEDAGYWLFWTLLFGLMPLWGGFVLLSLFSQSPSLREFTENGQFALYSASMLSVAFYIVSKDIGFKPLKELGRLSTIRLTFPASRFFIAVTSALTVVSSLIFASAISAEFPGVQIPLQLDLLESMTLIIFAITLGITFLISS